MSEAASQAAATAAGSNDSATVVHSSGGGSNPVLNPVFRTAPAPDTAGKPAGRQGAPQDRAGAQGDDGRSPEELLAEATQDGDGEDPLAKAQAEIAKWKTQALENEKRAKANADKAKNYDAYEESQKTEQQRLADQLAAAQREAQDAREDRFRLLACAQHDLPPELIPHLGGGTEDEITERAEAFAKAINERAAVIAAAQAQAAAAQQQPRNGNGFGRPVESLRPGALPASDNKPANPNEWFRGMLASSKNRQ
jgi:hypothetical protein